MATALRDRYIFGYLPRHISRNNPVRADRNQQIPPDSCHQKMLWRSGRTGSETGRVTRLYPSNSRRNKPMTPEVRLNPRVFRCLTCGAKASPLPPGFCLARSVNASGIFEGQHEFVLYGSLAGSLRADCQSALAVSFVNCIGPPTIASKVTTTASAKPAASLLLKQARPDLLPRNNIRKILPLPGNARVEFRALLVRQRRWVCFEALPQNVKQLELLLGGKASNFVLQLAHSTYPLTVPRTASPMIFGHTVRYLSPPARLCFSKSSPSIDSERLKFVSRNRLITSRISTRPRSAARSRMPIVPMTPNPRCRAARTPWRSSMRRRSTPSGGQFDGRFFSRVEASADCFAR